MTRTSLTRYLFVLSIAAWLSPSALAADPDAGKPNQAAAQKPARADAALDEELLKDLGTDPEMELPDEKPAARPDHSKSTASKPSDESTDDPLRQELLKGLDDHGSAGEDIGEAGEDNPLVRLSRAMREVEGLIARQHADQPTRQRQQQIVDELEKLIQQAQQQKSSSSSSSGGSKSGQKTASSRDAKQPQRRPGQAGGEGQQSADGPARESTTQTREQKARKPDMADMRDVLKGVWGQLPQRQREQMLQSYEERFLPKYEQMIADYFRSIAAEQERKP